MGQKNKEFGRASYPASNSRSLTHTKIQFHKSSHLSDMLVSLQSYYRLTLVIHASYYSETTDKPKSSLDSPCFKQKKQADAS